MTTQTKKAGRKSNAEKAVLAAQAQTQELAKVEVIDGEKVVTDLEPVSKAPVTLSVDADGEDLGDVSNTPAKTPVIEADEAPEPVVVVEQDDFEAKFGLTIVDDYKPILVPTMVGDAQTGHIPCPKAVFELVQIVGWQHSIKDHPAHVQAGLKSIHYWQDINGTVKVRCQSSSRFAEAK
jgi:hypothetical protein